MKLLHCRWCKDVVALDKTERTCKCGRSKGKYFSDGLNAEILGVYAVAIGFENHSFADAVRNEPESGMGIEFTAFVIPRNVPTILRH